MMEDFTQSLVRIAVSQICREAGFDGGVKNSALECLQTVVGKCKSFLTITHTPPKKKKGQLVFFQTTKGDLSACCG